MQQLDGHGGCALLQVERIVLGDVLEGGQQVLLVFQKVGVNTGQHLLVRGLDGEEQLLGEDKAGQLGGGLRRSEAQ